VLDADIPAWQIDNVKYGPLEAISSTTEEFHSLIDYTHISNAAEAVSNTVAAYQAYEDATAALAAPKGSALDAYKSASAGFIIALFSGEIGEIAGGVAVAGAAAAGLPALVGIGVGVAVGSAVAMTTQFYWRKLAQLGGYLPSTKTLALQSTSTSPDATNIINSDLSLGAPKVSPAWQFDPKTHEFKWLIAPDQERLREIATTLGLEKDNPVNFVIQGDKESDKNDLLFGGSGTDQIRGLTGDDVIIAQAGKDHVEGGLGNDRIDGGTGDDVLFGDVGNEQLIGSEGNDELNGGDGNDRLLGKTGQDILDGGAGADQIDGGDGRDKVVYAASPEAVVVALPINLGNIQIAYGGFADGDTLQNVEDIEGSKFADHLVGNSEDNALWGADGNDILEGDSGKDMLSGGAGNDQLTVDDVGLGDQIVGGTGFDNFKSLGLGNTWTDLLSVAGSTSFTVTLLTPQLSSLAVVAQGIENCTRAAAMTGLTLRGRHSRSRSTAAPVTIRFMAARVMTSLRSMNLISVIISAAAAGSTDCKPTQSATPQTIISSYRKRHPPHFQSHLEPMPLVWAVR
jgi:hemolysin type calcium-binding protein